MLKYLKYLKSVLLKPERVNHPPIHVQLEVTNYCNLKCKMCIRDNIKTNNKNMSFDEYKEIISQIKPQKVTLAGSGEPTIHKDLSKMIEYAGINNISTMISSNMTLLNNGDAEELVKSGLNVVKVSIDAATRQTYLNIRGEDCFEKIISNIGGIVSAKRKNGLNTPQIRFDYVILKDNVNEMPEVIRLAKNIGIDTVYFRPLQKVGLKEDVQKQLTKDFDAGALFESLKKTYEAARELKISTNVSDILSKINYYNELYELKLPWTNKICLLPWLQTFVAANGDVAPCCALYCNEGFKLGNIFEEGFENIWNGASYAKLRKKFKEHKLFDICRDCNPKDISMILSMIKFVPRFMENKR